MQQSKTDSKAPFPIHVWLTATQVAERYSVSVPTVWTWAKENRIPKPHKLAENTTRWRLSELDAHDDEQAAQGTYVPKKRRGGQSSPGSKST
jgi:predicted DNA-binding transcriptional regulator AlpA